MRVVVLYNEPVLPPDHPDAESEHEILYTADVVATTLEKAGFTVSRLGVGHDPAHLIAGMTGLAPDVVFNLYEGTADHGNTEAYVAGLLEWLGVPFTGSPSPALWLARSKHLTKTLLRGAGLPTPEFQVAQQLPLDGYPAEWPVIVKPALEDASVGIDQGSVVTTPKELDARVAYLLRLYGPPVLVERFIDGREFNLSLTETPDLRLRPISEIQFLDKGTGFWPIVTYDAKWKPNSRDFKATPPRFPKDLSDRLTGKLTDLATRAFRLVGCRDYARVDVRVSRNGQPHVIEVNPNPCISPLAGLAASLEEDGETHGRFVVDLVNAALKRRTTAGRRPGGSPPAARKADGRSAGPTGVSA
jgi:D-alanine-D-alanine ligase